MSHRGTFTTEYIYCDHCVEGIAKALEMYDHHIGNPYGYVQGYFSDMSETEGFWIFMNAISEANICKGHHPKIVVCWESRPPVILTLPVEQI